MPTLGRGHRAHCPHLLAERVAETVNTTWHRSTAATSRIEISLSVVAGLPLITTDATDGERLAHIGPAAAVLRSRPDGELIAVLCRLWTFYLNQRPT